MIEKICINNNMIKSTNELEERQVRKAAERQQFVMTSTNNLALLLSEILEQMQKDLANKTPGKKQCNKPNPNCKKPSMSELKDAQKKLNKKMKEGKKGEKGNQGESGQEGQQGENGKDGKGSEGKNGKDGKNGKEGNEGGEGEKNDGYGEGGSEEFNGELYKIYQQQQKLRQALQDKIGKEGSQGNAGDLIKQMEEVELDLINKGFTNQTLQKMMDLQHQLLKMESATFTQGEDVKRESKTNRIEYNKWRHTV